MNTQLREVAIPQPHLAEEAGQHTMKIRLGLISWATGALVLAAAAGCGGSSSDTPPPSPSVNSAPSETSTAPSPTSSPSPTSPSDMASADATDAMQAYLQVVDQLRQAPHTDPTPLESVASGAQLTAVQILLSRRREEGQRQIGDTVVREMTVQSVDVDGSDTSSGQVATVVIDVCWDVSAVDVVDKSGNSIVLPDRPDRGWTRYTVANHKYGKNPHGAWRVTTGQDLKETPCATS